MSDDENFADLLNEGEVRRFFEIYHFHAAAAFEGIERRGVLNLSRLHNRADGPLLHERFAIGDVDGMTAAAIAHARSGHNVWVEDRTVRSGLPAGSRGGKAETLGVFGLVIDSDADKGKGGSLPLPPTVTVESSPGNFHHHYFFSRALPPGVADGLGARLRMAADADGDTGNITQPYRVAGTPNLLTPKKRARGRVEPTPTRIIVDDGPVYSAETFSQALPELPHREPVAAVDGEARGLTELITTVPEWLLSELAAPATDDMDRSRHFFVVSGNLKARGFTFEEVLALWDHYPDAAASKYASRRGGVRQRLEADWSKLDTRDEAKAKGRVESSPEEIAALDAPANVDVTDEIMRACATQGGTPIPESVTRPDVEEAASPEPAIVPAPETAVGAPRPSAQAPIPPKQPPRLETLRAADLAGLPIPRREFLFADLFPARNVTSLYGDGGVGKSLLALQAAVAVSSGQKWLGMVPGRVGPVVYFGAEDERDELHIRLSDICAADNIELSALGDLHLIDMSGEDALLAVEVAGQGELRETPLYKRLVATVDALRPAMLIVDNLADAYGGSEISKSLARQFIGMLRKIAKRCDCYVLLLAHPSQAGKSSGEGSSGSTAWSNSVRQRLYLSKPSEPGEELLRDLQVMKANYTGTGTKMELRWDRGRFTPTTGGPVRVAGIGASKASMDAKADAVFLMLLAKVNHQGIRVFPSTGRNFAPIVFAARPDANGVTKKQFEGAMHRLLESGQVKVIEEGKPSQRVRLLVVASPDEAEM